LNQLGAILLAAGGSTRLGQPKQLLKIEGQDLVRRQAELLREQGFACVVAVTGAEHGRVQHALQGLAVQTVFNEHWQTGMGSSLAAGIAAMPERVRGALLLLCDQWKIDAEDLQALIKAWQDSPGKAVIAEWPLQSHESPAGLTSGPPTIFPRTLFASLIKLSGDRGAQQILKRHKAGVRRVLMPHAAFDIDLQSDLPSDIPPDLPGAVRR